MNEEKMYHIGLSKQEGARYVILTGDPGRVDKIAEYLDEPKFLCSNREYTSWEGKLLGEKVIVISTGIGGPSASICVEELIKIGADTFIRIGTCGGMQINVEADDIVISNGAIRMEGTSKEYIPIEYPAVPDFELTNNIVEVAKEMNVRYHVGVTQSKDSFYGQHSPDSMPVANELSNKWKAWIEAGCLASEMECAAIFSVASVRRARAGGLMLCVWNQERRDKLNDMRESHDTEKAIKLSVEAIKLTIQKDNQR